MIDEGQVRMSGWGKGKGIGAENAQKKSTAILSPALMLG